ncbi:MAG TPA: hypothetical protein VHI93_01100, partial [Candidatus Thermoplasmatota archaeon]|nr:hypothetical protein [Candidatus Thermoplasmatota archaeon]
MTMRPRLIAQLVHAADLDYVEHFQMLSAVNLEIRRSGPTAERLLRKAILEMDVGNFLASLAAAEDALALDPKSPEVRHQLGRINLRLALAKAGAPGRSGGCGVAAQRARQLGVAVAVARQLLQDVGVGARLVVLRVEPDGALVRLDGRL